jgi:hypothetical protein
VLPDGVDRSRAKNSRCAKAKQKETVAAQRGESEARGGKREAENVAVTGETLD